jgi:excisionase family DNA binding protein
VSTPAFAHEHCHVLTIAEAAARLGIHRQTLRAAIERGDIRAIRVGRRWLIPVAAIDELLGGHRAGA